MRFDQLDTQMRAFETLNEQRTVPGAYVVVRLDGRGFTKLTAALSLQKPFDERFRDLMVQTTESLFECGFDWSFGYTQSDEISLLFNPTKEIAFNGKIRKFNSLLAGQASATCTLALDRMLMMTPLEETTDVSPVAVFDCRTIQFSNKKQVIDYFRWRQEDANRNALNGYAYWTLRNHDKLSGTKASKILEGQSVSFKNQLLFDRGINYNDVPGWQKRGVGISRKTVPHVGFNPKTGEHVQTTRNKLVVEYNIPYGEEYSTYIGDICESSVS